MNRRTLPLSLLLSAALLAVSCRSVSSDEPAERTDPPSSFEGEQPSVTIKTTELSDDLIPAAASQQSAIEKPAPAVETVEPRSAESAPVEEKPAPAEEKPAPAEENPAPAEEKPAPVEEKPTPAEEKPAPAEAKPAPAEENPAPAEEKPAPAEAKSAPAEAKPAETAEPAVETAEPRSAETVAPAPKPPSIPWRTPTYTLVARELPLREALDSFAIAQGLSLVPSQGVSGTFSGDFTDLPPGEFLEQVCSMNNLTWYYDGAALYIYGAGEIETSLVDLSYMKAGEVRTMLRDLGVEDGRFPLKTTSDDELVMVSGPPRYVALVMQTIAKADRLRELRTVSRMETRIFPIRNTWADDVSFSAGSPEGSTSIKGVATILSDIMSGENPAMREAGSTGAVDRAQMALDGGVKPIIRADSRVNAVLVRDIASRMPMYEALIEQLDVPVPLVEIAVTILDMDRESALDWELEVRAEAAKKKWAGAAGQAVGNLTDTAGITGTGLAGALTYLGSDFNLAASLNALRSKGWSRTISRPSLLTVNNLAAEMTDTQTYHTRIVGESVASLESVSAGIKLSVKPRIVEAAENDGRPQIWLSVEINDGGFEAIAVDSMPMTRDSKVLTQAAVREGDSIAIGGYLRDIDIDKEWGIPILRDIPLLGWLFGGYSTSKTSVQRLFILTPYIVDIESPELVREQASRLRDIRVIERLSSDKDIDDDLRELRDMERDFEDERRQRRLRNEIDRRKAEIRFERERMKAETSDDSDLWRDDLEARREAWLRAREEAATEKAVHEAEKAAEEAEKAVESLKIPEDAAGAPAQ